MDAHTDIAAMKPENNKQGRGMRPSPAFLDAPLSLCLGEKSSQIPQEASGSLLEASIRGFLNHVGAPLSCSSHPCLCLSRLGLVSSRAETWSPVVPGPWSQRVILPTNYWKLKPGNSSPSAGHQTTNHLLAHPEGDRVTPPAPTQLHHHGQGQRGNRAGIRVFR